MIHLNIKMNRTDLINYLITKYQFKSYLEIGCSMNVNFNQINCETKVGVDPERGGTHRMTSDRFFEVNKIDEVNKTKYDIIFIDGLHIADQVMRDIINSIDCLNTNGIIVLHDCNPPTELHQSWPMQQGDWNGDAWKAVVHHRQLHNIDLIVGNFDWGCGVLRKKPNTDPLVLTKWYSDLTYKDLEDNRQRWLRLSSFEEIQRWLDQGDV